MRPHDGQTRRRSLSATQRDATPSHDVAVAMAPGRSASSEAVQRFVRMQDFRNQADRWIRQAEQTQQPVVITRAGQPFGVLLSPAEFDHLVQHKHILQDMASNLDDYDDDAMESELLKRLVSGPRASSE